MGKYIIILFLMSISCVAQIDSTSPAETVESSGEEPGVPPDYDHDLGPSGCEAMYSTEVMLPNGAGTVQIPADCDPHYVDKGDPPPDKTSFRETIINPPTTQNMVK